MRKLGLSIAILLVILIAAVAIAPYFLGRRVESEFKSQLALINSRQSDVQFQLRDYVRGFYRSEATLAVIPAKGISPQVIRIWALLLGSGPVTPEIHISIYQGPIPLAAFASHGVDFRPVLYAAEFQGTDLPNGSLLGNLKIDSYTVCHFDGSTLTLISVPTGSYNLGMFDVQWAGGSTELSSNADSDHITYRGVFGTTQFSFENAKSGAVYTGTLQGMQFDGNKTKVAPAFWEGRSRLRWDGLAVQVGQEVLTRINTWEWDSNNHVAPSGGSYSATLDSHQHGGSLRAWHWSSLVIRSRLQNLNVAGTTRFIQKLRSTQASSDLQAQRNFLTKIPSLLATIVNPQTQGDFKLTLTAPGGTFEVDATLHLDPPPAIAHGHYSAESLKQSMNVQANIKFDGQLVNGFARQVMGQAAAQMIKQTLQDWLTRGLLQSQSVTGSLGVYHALVVWHHGKLSINGQHPDFGSKQT